MVKIDLLFEFSESYIVGNDLNSNNLIEIDWDPIDWSLYDWIWAELVHLDVMELNELTGLQ